MESKVCKICSIEKPLGQFEQRGNSRGLGRSECFKCRAEKRPARVRKKRPPQEAKPSRRYERGPRGPVDASRCLKTYISKRAWIDQNPEKRRAHKDVAAAVRHGGLIRPANCNRCGCGDRKILAHHDDYAKPLDVMWLCPGCHVARHDEIGKPMVGSRRLRRQAARPHRPAPPASATVRLERAMLTTTDLAAP